LSTTNGSPHEAAASRAARSADATNRPRRRSGRGARARTSAIHRAAASFGAAALLFLAAPGTAVAPAVARTTAVENAAAPRPVPVSVAIRPAAETGAERPGLSLDVGPTAGRTCRPDPDDVATADPNERLQFGDMRVPRWIVETIRRAAAETGVDPVYLMALADKESSFVVEAKPSTSSAEGLFQFVTDTWLQVVKVHGPKHGLHAEAAAIVSAKGQLGIPDGETRERILNLRRDPYLSALMAAEMLKRDRARIEAKVGRNLDATDSYLAHFLGADSAGRFMALLGDKPQHSASKVFPRAARANKALFYARDGGKVRHLSVAEVYDRIDRMMEHRLERYEGVAEAAVPAPKVEEFLERLAGADLSPDR